MVDLFDGPYAVCKDDFIVSCVTAVCGSGNFIIHSRLVNLVLLILKTILRSMNDNLVIIRLYLQFVLMSGE